MHRRTPSNFLQKAIGEVLKSVGIPVYDYVTENTPFPYITIGEETERPWDSKTGAGSETEHEVHIWSLSKGYKECKDIAQKVLNARFEPEMFSSETDGWHCVSVELSSIEHERFGAELRHGVVTFKFYIQDMGG